MVRKELASLGVWQLFVQVVSFRSGVGGSRGSGNPQQLQHTSLVAAFARERPTLRSRRQNTDSGSHGFRRGPSELLLRRSRDRALNLTAQGSIITLRFLWRHRVLLVRSVL